MAASSKTRYIAEASIRAFFARHPVTFYWTFTFADEVLEKGEAQKRFKPLVDLIRARGGEHLEFWELHPSGHGWHVHLLTDLYLDVNWLRPWLVRRRWGPIMKVKKVQSRRVWIDGEGWVRDDREEARLVRYLCKYLTKAFAAASQFKKKCFGGSAQSKIGTTLFKWVPWLNPWSYLYAVGAARFRDHQGRCPRFTEMNLVLRIGYHVSGWSEVDPWLLIDGPNYNST